MELKGLVAIVTGAGRGIGKAIAHKFVSEGASVSLWSRNADQLKQVAEALDPSGEKVFSTKVDVSNELEVQNGISEILRRFNRIDILVNNAGNNYPFTPIEEMTLEMFDTLYRVNLAGTFLCCRAATSTMKKQGRGKIINISSQAGRTGRKNVGVNYAAAKAGVIGLTKALARELGPAGIYVNCIAPGPIITELMKQFPADAIAAWNAGRAIDRDGLPEDIADAAVFLASDRSDWVTGVTIDVCGGIHMF